MREKKAERGKAAARSVSMSSKAPEPAESLDFAEVTNVQAARVLGAYILAAAIALGISLIVVALVIVGFPALPSESGYLVFLAALFVVYCLYQWFID